MKKRGIVPFVLTVSVFAAARATALECPGTFDPDGDWDRDGILNAEEACCFTATLFEHNDEAVCPDDGAQDLNMNGLSAEQEGRCCLLNSGGCARADSNVCEAEGVVPVEIPCDRLLVYGGMESPTAVESCGTSCICHTVEDFDGDFEPSDSEQESGAADNCPMDPNPRKSDGIQPNGDEDLFGDACDSCDALFDEPLPCEMGLTEDLCPGDSMCVPFLVSSDRLFAAIEFYCSQPDRSDKDRDGVGDECDNCPDIPNTSQADENGNDIGDACDPDTQLDTDPDTEGREDTEEPDASVTDTEFPDASVNDTETEQPDASVSDTETGEDTGEDTATDSEKKEDTATESDSDSEPDSDSEQKDTEPSDTEPKDTEPNDTEPIDTEPIDTESKDTETEDTDSETDTEEDKKGDMDSDGYLDFEDNCPEVANPDQNISACADDLYMGGACDCGVAPGRAPQHHPAALLLALLGIGLIWRLRR